MAGPADGLEMKFVIPSVSLITRRTRFSSDLSDEAARQMRQSISAVQLRSFSFPRPPPERREKVLLAHGAFMSIINRDVETLAIRMSALINEAFIVSTDAARSRATFLHPDYPSISPEGSSVFRRSEYFREWTSLSLSRR
jgi:hypothetical protein